MFKIKKTEQKGAVHLIVIIVVVLVTAISLAFWRISTARQKDSTSGYNTLMGKTYKTSTFVRGGTKLVFPSSWGNFIADEPVKKEYNLYSSEFVVSGSFDNLGQNNSLTVYEGSSIISSLSGRAKDGCETLDTKNQKYYGGDKVNQNYPKCRLFGSKDSSKTELIVKATDSQRLLFMSPDNISSTVGYFSPKEGLMYKLIIYANDADISVEGGSDGCCATPPIYKDGTVERIYNVYLDVASTLIGQNKN